MLPSATGLLRNRAGSALPLVVMSLVGMSAAGALAIDISQRLASKNQLQTLADAAAIAGAAQLNKNPATAASVATGIATANRTDTSIVVDSVVFGVWSDASRGFTTVGSAWSADAVRLVVHQQPRQIFARIIEPVLKPVTARATAWAGAPVQIATCGKPWALPYGALMEVLGKTVNDPLTDADMRAIRDTTGANKKYVQVHLDGGNGSSPTPGNYLGLDFPPVNDTTRIRNGTPGYAPYISGCMALKVGDRFQIEPGVKTGPTMNGVQNMCKPLANGVCYNDKGGVGVPVAAPVWKPWTVTANGARSTVTADFIAAIMVTNVTNNADVTGFLYGIADRGPVMSQRNKSPTRNTMAVTTILVR